MKVGFEPAIQIERPRGKGGHGGSVGEHVRDRDLALPVGGVLRDEIRDAILDVKRTPLAEHVHDKRRDRLRTGVDEKRCLRRGQHLPRVLGVLRPVPASMPNRTIHCARAVPPNTDLDRRVDAAAVEIDHPLQIRPAAAASMPPAAGSSSSPIVVTDSRSAGTSTRRRGSGSPGRRGIEGICGISTGWIGTLLQLFIATCSKTIAPASAGFDGDR